LYNYLSNFRNIKVQTITTQQTTLFDIWNKDVQRKWVIEQVGNSISSIFKGERTYISILCRGYGRDHEKAYYRTKIRAQEVLFLLLSAGCILLLHIYTTIISKKSFHCLHYFLSPSEN